MTVYARAGNTHTITARETDHKKISAKYLGIAYIVIELLTLIKSLTEISKSKRGNNFTNIKFRVMELLK